MERSIALVVSHNRHQSLVACIEAIRRQTVQPDAILVVNNDSTDYTSVWLDQQEDIIHLCQKNTGSAGGFAAGLEYAHKYGFTWIWCMDDDGYAKEDALEKLLSQRLTQPILINSLVVDKDDKQSLVWKTNGYSSLSEINEEVLTGIAHPFNGSLIHRKVVEIAGLPNRNLFCRGDEAEYFYRITRRHRIKAVTVTSSIYYHPARKYSYAKEWKLDASWGTYYHVRNRMAILQSQYNNRILTLFMYFGFVIRFAGKILLQQRTQRTGKLALVLRSFSDALTGNYQATPSAIMYKIRHQYTTPLKNMFLVFCKNALSAMLLPKMAEA